MIGDSLVFGFGVEDEERYPVVLESLLNERFDGQVEVIPIAGVGYRLSKYRELLLPKALEFDPDIIVLGFVLNDFESPPRPNMDSGGDPSKNRFWLLEAARRASLWLRPNSHLVCLVRDRFQAYYSAHLMDKGELVRYWELTSMFPDSAEFQRRLQYTKRQLDEVVAECQRHGVPLLLGVTPLEVQLSMDRVRHYRQYIPDLPGTCVEAIPQRNLEEYCQSRDVVFVDVTDTFRAQSAPVFLERVANRRDLCHPNALGHRLMAEELAGRLVDMLDKPRNRESGLMQFNNR